MNTEINVYKLIEEGEITNELDYNRALKLYNKLRVPANKSPKYKALRRDLEKLILDFEEKYEWSEDEQELEKQIKEGDKAEKIAELERQFLRNRKELIKQKIKEKGLKQEDFGKILGHNKSYTSELMNGVYPFSMKDLIIIHRLFKIELEDLIPPFVPEKDKSHIKDVVNKLDKPDLRLNKDDLEPA